MLRDMDVEANTSNLALGISSYPRPGLFRNFWARSIVSQNNRHEKGCK